MADLTTCPDCGRQAVHADSFFVGACSDRGGRECLRAQLATAEAKVAELERETTAWRGLAEWERYTNDRSVAQEDCGFLPAGAPFRMSAYDGTEEHFATGSAAGPCAIALAEKLGILKKGDSK